MLSMQELRVCRRVSKSHNRSVSAGESRAAHQLYCSALQTADGEHIAAELAILMPVPLWTITYKLIIIAKSHQVYFAIYLAIKAPVNRLLFRLDSLR